jgi:diguanylate cyclase (GGDEF)-like protein/PAS domain S-box-containing protein
MLESDQIYVVIVILSLVIPAILGIYAFAHGRGVAGAGAFAILQIPLILWSLAVGCMTFSNSPQSALFWSNLRYLGISFAPCLLLIFLAQHARQSRWVTPLNLTLLFLIPAVTQLFVWFEPIWFGEASFYRSGDLWVMALHPSLWFYIYAVYTCSLVLISVLILIEAVYHTKAVYRKQNLALLAGLLIPVSASVYTLVYPAGEQMISPVPLALALMSLIFAWALFRYQLFELTPVARSQLVDTMQDAVLVIDDRDQIIDVNPAALDILGCTTGNAIGHPASEVLQPWQELLDPLLSATAQVKTEINLQDGGAVRCYDLQISPLTDQRGRSRGRMVILRDITPLAQNRDRLQAQLEEIQILQAELHEQAVRDPLTGLFNRRYLIEALTLEFSRALRGAYPVSLLMIDVDFFKRVNDSFGHQAGDYVLQMLADHLRAQTRAGDVVCRYAGDEFLLVMPLTPLQAAHQRAEELRQSFRNAGAKFAGVEIRTTISIGVAAYPEHGISIEEVLAAADEAVYAAKSAGRNCVMICRQSRQLTGPHNNN